MIKTTKPNKIIGATTSDAGNVLFKVDWGNNNESYILSTILQQYHPQVVIDFYEPLISVDGDNNTTAVEDRIKIYNENKYSEVVVRDFTGLIPRQILGINYGDQTNFKYVFLMRWANKDEPDMVIANDVYRWCPRMAIDFFESRIVWKETNQVDIRLLNIPNHASEHGLFS